MMLINPQVLFFKKLHNICTYISNEGYIVLTVLCEAFLCATVVTGEKD